jgi:hypothetical protein
LLATLLIPYSRMMIGEKIRVGRRDVIIIIIIIIITIITIILISSWLLINLLKWLKVDDRM